jgi:hypothetical protein
VQAYDAIKRYSEMMEVPLNLEKSQGVSLIARQARGEIASKESIDFLGYRISLSSIAIKEKRVASTKAKIAHIIYQNLLQPLTHGTYNVARLAGLDWDYVVALSQIRRYLYGGLNDEKLRKYIRGQIPRLNFRGLMSYYPLVNDDAQLTLLDGWLIYVLKQSLKKRQALWDAKSGIKLPGPIPDWIDNLTALKTWKPPGGGTYDLRVPSFSLVNKAMRIAIENSGIGAATHPASAYY